MQHVRALPPFITCPTVSPVCSGMLHHTKRRGHCDNERAINCTCGLDMDVFVGVFSTFRKLFFQKLFLSHTTKNETEKLWQKKVIKKEGVGLWINRNGLAQKTKTRLSGCRNLIFLVSPTCIVCKKSCIKMTLCMLLVAQSYCLWRLHCVMGGSFITEVP